MTKMTIPMRMAHLPRDQRGYPIPVIILVKDGRPHFTINDEEKRQAVIADDGCSICGLKLHPYRWLVGGPRCAFDPMGAYLDPSMHDECAHYALRVCPYLAAPSYARLVDGRTLKDRSGIAIVADEAVNLDRPSVFVAVKFDRYELIREGDWVRYVKPLAPYLAVEYWRAGERVEAPD